MFNILKSDEIEVSLFGPGYGETIVIHLGQEHWIIVDSCVRSPSKKPVAIEYLERIGRTPSEVVKCIVATHWHDDHIRGLSDIVNECDKAAFVCSSVLDTQEFLELACMHGNAPLIEYKGTTEFSRILEILYERNNRPKYVLQDSLIAASTDPEYAIYALSPSNKANECAKLQFAQLLPDSSHLESQKALPIRRPNLLSVALLIIVDKIGILLGSDLEGISDPDIGWPDVVTNSVCIKDKKSTIYKVPHHGSSNADIPAIWSELLIDDPIAVLTPHLRGNNNLPTDCDVARIRGYTIKAYITSRLYCATYKKRPYAVRRTLKEVKKSIKILHPPVGHVCVRGSKLVDCSYDWRIKAFEPAGLLRPRN